MDFTNRKIILIAMVIIIIIAIFAGIIIKNSISSDQNKQLNSSENGISINNAITNETTNNRNLTIISEANTGSVTPIVTFSATPSNSQTANTGSVTPIVTFSATPSNSQTANHISTVPDNEEDRTIVQVFFSEDLNPNNPNPFLEEQLASVSDAKATLIKTGYSPDTNALIYEIVNIPNNPLMASNCIVDGKPAYTFANVKQPSQFEHYIVQMERNGRIWTVNGDPGGVHSQIRKNASVDIIPSDLTSGTLYGYVRAYDHATHGAHLASGANVTLYYYQSTKGMVNISSNPQMSASGSEVGLFRFDGLQPGFYNITAEKDGEVGYSNIAFTGATNGLCVDILIA